MIQRYLHQLLQTGVQALQQNPTILEDIFQKEYLLEETEVDAIQAIFVREPPNVQNGYPRADAKFPLYCIVLGVEGEAENLIGDSGGQVEDPDDPDYGANILTAIWDHVYQIFVYTEHPDVTAYYYEIAKSIIVSGLETLTNVGLFEFHLSGMDLAPDPRYQPESFYVRQLTFKCQREFQRIDKQSSIDKAFRVAGLAIDRSGSPSDIGGVKDLVTTYMEGEEDGET